MAVDSSSTTPLESNVPAQIAVQVSEYDDSLTDIGLTHKAFASYGIGFTFQQQGSVKARLRPPLKRSIDIALSLSIVTFILPTLLLIVILLLLNGHTPLFSHQRIGQRGRSFGCLKFRTMVRNADKVLASALASNPHLQEEWTLHRKLRNDPRVTRLGRLLRLTSMDELPQLFNVLAGHMSLVGPRPVTKDELATFYSPIEAALYLTTRPGLTGLWQVSGRSDTSYATRVTLDCHYVRHLSLRTDFAILMRTVRVVLCSRGAC